MSLSSSSPRPESEAAAPDAAAPGPVPGRRPAGRRVSLRYFAVKLLGALVSLLAVMVTSFFLFRVIPGDPVAAMTQGRKVTPEQREELFRQFGLDQPLWQQFLGYLRDLLRLDLGLSYQYKAPVTELIATRLGPTLLLVGTATLIAAALGLWLGTRAGWRRGSTADRVHTGVALTLFSVPTFWLGLLMIVVLAGGAGGMPHLFPTGGMGSPDVSGVGNVIVDTAHHMVLPVATLVAVLYAQYLMIMRSSLLDEMGSDYLVTARAKGLRDDLVLRRHAVPNALLPTVTLLFLKIGQVVSGTILVEAVFSWPGLGMLFYEGLSVPDLPLVQGLFIFFSASVIFMNLLADFVYPLFDPRVRT
ncbi:peptide/nickel transport system permease protein [Murinocardiopsis flavida]|uniref:Peptide/nickel transport system permease protein n=1 Tax=Murinocardiopsis flavida TaxID=645275 RepID=A0A2P8CZW1_9ACTN|nr:ABC transporter permease [Murinocardiopsis flavida]PSK90487.1 peptide/nickel transport system permease protein [Murinocardiopsis flavida]